MRYTQSGTAVASFTVAVNRRFVEKDSGQPTADFIPVVAWNKLAEICGSYLAKGSQCIVEGRLQIRSYDAQDGSKRWVSEIVADEVEFIGGKHTESATSPADSFGPRVPDEDVPF